MAIKDLMTHGVEAVKPDETVAAAATKMAERDIGFLAVCDGERLVGALTDRDITVRAVARGLDPNQTAVSDIMSGEVTWCFDDEDIERTAQLMKEKQLRRVVVVDRDTRLVGVVSLGDLARQQEGQSADVLESVSAAPPNR
jgi:CBS domain-containing protein